MFIERVEVLMGASVDENVAKRYLLTVASSEVEESLKPSTRARPEDAFETYVRATGIEGDYRTTFRKQWLALKAVSSNWFVHPTALGPLWSRQVRDDPAGAVENWGLLLQALGCRVKPLDNLDRHADRQGISRRHRPNTTRRQELKE